MAPREALLLRRALASDPLSAGTVSGNVIVNTIAGVPAATFQSINKRLASPVAPGALTVSLPSSVGAETPLVRVA